MLLGQYIQKVAPKNRIALPYKLRQELGENLVVSQGFESSLLILSKKRWEILVSESVQGEITTKEIRDISRFLLGGAVEIDLDSQGRFIMPQSLKDFAKIGTTVVFVGLLRWVELWDLALWQDYSQDLAKASSKIAQRLKKLK